VTDPHLKKQQGHLVTTTSPPSARSARARKKVGGYAVVLLALSLVGTLYTAFGAAAGSAQEAAPAAQSLAVKEGRALYLTGCSTCHGINLQGTESGPSLIGVGASSVIFQVGTGRMPLAAGVQQAPRKQPAYTEAEIQQLAAYVQANGGGPTLPEGDLTEGDLSVGGDLFRTNCASCHNFAGSGGALTYGNYAPELEPADAEEIYAAMQVGPEAMPRYSDAQLSVEEKKAITRYVEYITSSGDPGGASLGRLGPISEGLAAWLVGITALVGITLWIGARA
jgi:ubiquinol-cytochrome c reductase cytochrome c subunit